MNGRIMGSKTCGALLVVAATCTAPRAQADDDTRPPSSGVGLLVTGGIFTGIGVLNLVTAPICKSSGIPTSIQDACLGLSLGIGGGFAAIGIPLLIVGGVKRSAFNEWKEAHPALAGLSFVPTRGGAAVGWSGTF